MLKIIVHKRKYEETESKGAIPLKTSAKTFARKISLLLKVLSVSKEENDYDNIPLQHKQW